MKKLLAILALFAASPVFADRTYTAGSINKSAYVRIIDAGDGSAETGVTSATSGLDLEYLRSGAAPVDLTESDLGSASAAHTDGGIIHVGGGRYRVDIPDAAFRPGVPNVDVQGAVTGMTVIPETISLAPEVPAQIPGLLFWIEPRLGGLYQDSAGTTTPAAANDDPVGFAPDLSGNGFPAIQATAGNRPLLKTAGLSSAYASMLFDGTNDNLTLGATVGNIEGDATSTRVYVVQPVAVDGFRILGYKAGPVSDDINASTTLFPSGSVGARVIRDAYSGSTGTGPGAIAAATPYLIVVQQKIVYLGNGTTASNTMKMFQERIWINGHLASDQYQTVTAWSDATEWTLGGAGASFPTTGHISLACAYAGDVSEAQLNLLGTYVAKNYGIAVGDHHPPSRTGLPIGTFFIGDSLTKAIGANGHPWPLIVSRLLSDKFVTTPNNFGITGLNTVDADTNLRPVMVPGENIATVFLGTNPLGSGTAAATAYSQLVTKCQALQALGIKVIVLTLPDRNAGFSGGIDTASFETARQTFNTSVRTNYATFADALVDVGLDGTQVINGVTHDFSALGDAAAAVDTNYFTDGTHLAISSHYIIAAAVADAHRVLIGDVSNLANRTTIVALPYALPSETGGLPTVDASNRIAGVVGDVGGNVVGSIGSVATGGITATSIATDAIGSDEITAAAVTEIQNGLATAAALATVNGYVDTEIGTLTTNLATANTNINTLLTSVDAVPTNSELNARTLLAAEYATATALDTVDNFVDGEVAAIKVVTDKVDTALELDTAVYRWTANALEQAPTGGGASAATIADAVWDEARAGHVTAGTFGFYLDASISGVSGGGGASAGDIADAVWDEVLSGHVTVGSAAVVLTDTLDYATLTSAQIDNVGTDVDDVKSDTLDLVAAVDLLPTTAELNTALDPLPTAAENATAVWASGTRVLTGGTNIVLAKGTGITGFNDLDAAGIRAAVGLAAANLDTQLEAGSLPLTETGLLNFQTFYNNANAVSAKTINNVTAPKNVTIVAPN